MSKQGPDAPNRLALIASKGTLDWAYPPFILASAAASMGWEVGVFFTFYGLTLLLKDIAPEVSPLGNPAMPMPVPIPALVATLPSMQAIATAMMKSMFKKHGVATVGELLALARESGVRLIACQMTMDVMGVKAEDLVEGVEVGGAATWMDAATDAQVNLFV